MEDCDGLGLWLACCHVGSKGLAGVSLRLSSAWGFSSLEFWLLFPDTRRHGKGFIEELSKFLIYPEAQQARMSEFGRCEPSHRDGPAIPRPEVG